MDDGRSTMEAQLPQANYRLPGQDDKMTRRQDDKMTEAQDQREGTLSPPHRVIVSRKGSPVVDEKVLVAPLVTLDLPLDAFLPPEYIPDERVRLSVYQHMAEAQTPRAVADLRRELTDRFGKPPEPTDHLLTWLLIKALALQAGVTSIVTTDEEFIIRLPEGSALDREKLRRRFGRDATVRIGPQFARLDRRSLNGKWVDALTGVLETLAK
jgi:transcription-repair coupling factor (superfamily II helicase)